MPINANAEFLAHHGVPKQKWGERRYQNKDGSLTALGREHRRLTRPSRANSDTETKKKPTLKEVYESKKKARAEKEQAKVEAKKQAAMEAETKRLAKQQEEVQAQKAAQEKYIAEAREKAMYTKDPKVLYDNMQYLNAAEAKAAKERMDNILNVQKMIPKQQTKWDKAMKNLDNLNEYYKTISASASNVNKTLKAFGIDIGAELKKAAADEVTKAKNKNKNQNQNNQNAQQNRNNQNAQRAQNNPRVRPNNAPAYVTDNGNTIAWNTPATTASPAAFTANINVTSGDAYRRNRRQGRESSYWL